MFGFSILSSEYELSVLYFHRNSVLLLFYFCKPYTIDKFLQPLLGSMTLLVNNCLSCSLFHPNTDVKYHQYFIFGVVTVHNMLKSDKDVTSIVWFYDCLVPLASPVYTKYPSGVLAFV